MTEIILFTIIMIFIVIQTTINLWAINKMKHLYQQDLEKGWIKKDIVDFWSRLSRKEKK